MYSRSPNRINRSKGIKVKHILQICLLVAVCFWLIYQVKHSHEKKKEFDEKDAKLASNTRDAEILRLGRKDISRAIEVGRDDKINVEDDEENESDQAENRHEDDEQEREESRAEEREEEEDAGKGGEDDEIDRREEEENHEEFVDEEKDREETDEKNEGNDVSEKEDNEEIEAVQEDQDQEGETRNTHEAREEQYKADDASSEVAHDTRSIVSDAENATLKHTDSERIIDGKENVSQSSNQPLLDGNSHEPIKGTNSSDSRVSESMEHKGNSTVSEYSTSENSTALLESSDQSQVSSSLTQLKSEQSNNITQAQNATSEDSHNEGFNATLSLFSNANTSDLASDKNPLDIKTVTNSTELANTTSAEAKLSLAENITNATEKTVEDGNSINAGTDDNPESNSEDNVTGGEDESSNTETANDNVGADDLHDNVDDFASSLIQEEKEYRTDTGTLSDIKLEVQNDDDIEAE